MATKLSFDELNQLLKKRRAMPFEQYFGEMRIDDKQKRRRIRFAEWMYEELVGIFAEAYYGTPDKKKIEEELLASYIAVISKAKIDKDTEKVIQPYLFSFADEIARTTTERAEEPYYLSADRAMYIAENEANSILNLDECEAAKRRGNRYKRWVAIIDKVTRDTHAFADGQAVEIDTPFRVGDSLMQFPKDTSLGADPSEIINCRCSCLYFK